MSQWSTLHLPDAGHGYRQSLTSSSSHRLYYFLRAAFASSFFPSSQISLLGEEQKLDPSLSVFLLSFLSAAPVSPPFLLALWLAFPGKTLHFQSANRSYFFLVVVEMAYRVSWTCL